MRDAWELRGDAPDKRVLFIRYPQSNGFAQPCGPAPGLRQELLDLRCRTREQRLGKPDPFALQFTHNVKRFVAFLRLEPIDAQDHGIDIGIRGRELMRIVLARRQHLLVALDVALDRIV